MTSARSDKPIFGPAPSKEIFAQKWCAHFKNRQEALFFEGHRNLDKNAAITQEYIVAFESEAQALGFREKDFPPDINILRARQGKPMRFPGEFGFHYTNPFRACRHVGGTLNGTRAIVATGMFEEGFAERMGWGENGAGRSD